MNCQYKNNNPCSIIYSNSKCSLNVSTETYLQASKYTICSHPCLAKQAYPGGIQYSAQEYSTSYSCDLIHLVLKRIKGVKVNKLEYDNRKFNIIPLILQLVYIYNTKLPQSMLKATACQTLLMKVLYFKYESPWRLTMKSCNTTTKQ